MHDFLKLLGLVLIGCRDAAYSRSSSRLLLELRLGQDLLDILCKPSDLKSRLARACERFTDSANRSGDEALRLRSEIYSSLTTSIRNSVTEPLEKVSLAMSSETLDAIAIGLSKIDASLDSGDLRRCEIEAEHIHNLPATLEPAASKSREYYKTTERQFYLDQLRDHAGSTVEKEAATAFAPFWRSIMT